MPSLSDTEIAEARAKGLLVIDPFIADNLQPGSIDLTLYKFIEVLDDSQPVILPVGKEDIERRTKVVDISTGYVLKAGSFVTGYSNEQIRLPSNINGIITNRNSLARIGLNAGISSYINPGFHGRKVIVIKNESRADITIKAGLRICQLVLFHLGSETLRSYDNRHNEAEILSKLKEKGNGSARRTPGIDDSLSDFLNKRIAQMAGNLS